MKTRLVELIACPECLESLRLEPFAGCDEIDEGRLICLGCGRVFPIITGVPRLLPDALAHVVPPFHAEFFRRHREAMTSYLARCAQPPTTPWRRAEQRTVRSYSYQWRKFRQMFPHWEQVFRDAIRPITPEFFPGKLGLDAGCGFGRSLRYAVRYGAEMIGLDVSEAVEAARENTRELPGAHVVQGDIFHLPIRPATLDFVYSIGVLHHLPDPAAGFRALTTRLTPGGAIFIWVYARGRGRQIPVMTLTRALTTRLPLPVLDAVCLACAAGQWLAWIVPYRLLDRWRATRPLAHRLPFTRYAQYPFRVLHTDWVDAMSVPLVQYYRREEIETWLRGAGLTEITVEPDWQGRALGYRPTAETQQRDKQHMTSDMCLIKDAVGDK